MKNTELEQMLTEIKDLRYPHTIDVVDAVMKGVEIAEEKHRQAVRTHRRIGWTIGATGSIAAAVAVLVMMVGNGSPSQAKGADNSRLSGFISAVYSNPPADVVYYDPDDIDILLGLDE